MAPQRSTAASKAVKKASTSRASVGSSMKSSSRTSRQTRTSAATKPSAAKKTPRAAATASKPATTSSSKTSKTTVVPKTRKQAAARASKPAVAAKRQAAPRKGKSTSTATASSTKPVTGKRGLKGNSAPDSSKVVGKVDPAASLSANAVLVPEQDGDCELNTMLTEIDISKHVDKYYMLQVICESPNPKKRRKAPAAGKGKSKASGVDEQFYFFSRWGRTGTAGSCNLQGPFDDVEEATALFAAKFQEKTGNDWNASDREDRYVVHDGKYTCLRPNTKATVLEPWQYWVDDGVDGKADGWYDYDDVGAAMVEQLDMEFKANPGLYQRVVASGAWTYLVDLRQMTQTNITHPGHKCRHIRRNPARSLGNTPPGNGSSSKSGAASPKKGKGPAAPSAKAKAVMTKAATTKAATTKAAKAKTATTKAATTKAATTKAPTTKAAKAKAPTTKAAKAKAATTKAATTKAATTKAAKAKAAKAKAATTKAATTKAATTKAATTKAAKAKAATTKAATTKAPTTKAATTKAAKAKAATKAAPPIASAEVDKACPKAGDPNVTVCDRHDVKLNRTDIGANKNKYYILQMCYDAGRAEYFVWCRWGRVGENGSCLELGPFFTEPEASKEFAKKFREKTANKWQDTLDGHFEPVVGKYELIETDSSDPNAEAVVTTTTGGASSGGSSVTLQKVLSSKLDPATRDLVELIFSEDMFKSAMSNMNVDVKKMPLGQLSKAQVQKGYTVLEELEGALGGNASNRTETLETLSAKFYQVIPHAFGRSRPPVIDTEDHLRKKVEMLNVLQDIHEAQTILSSNESGKGGSGNTVAAPPALPHPTDVNYDLLNADITPVNPLSKEYEIIRCYMENTKAQFGQVGMLGLWSVNRSGEGKRFDEHKSITNRKLLWHGTNVAVVAAIVKSGLRIMPHSGGRVGRGIYFASENAKSYGYVRPAYKVKGASGNVGIMFLCEAALGKEATITRDDGSLRQPPKGFDSVVARGRQEPDFSKDTVITLDGKRVTVPQGNPLVDPCYSNSNFWNSEYLIYKESQQRIRYMMTVQCS